MTEFDRAVRRLAADFARAGATRAPSDAALRAYERALGSASFKDWRAFYAAALAALREAAVGPGRRDARARLVRLFDDDLGATLVSAAEREWLRARFVEAA